MHGFLVAWLILMIIGNALSALFSLAAGSTAQTLFPEAPGWAFPFLGILSALNVGFVIALFNWKKWGFYGICATSFAGLITNLSIGVGLSSSIFGLIGLVILYGVLHIGNERKAWPKLV